MYSDPTGYFSLSELITAMQVQAILSGVNLFPMVATYGWTLIAMNDTAIEELLRLTPVALGFDAMDLLWDILNWGQDSELLKEHLEQTAWDAVGFIPLVKLFDKAGDARRITQSAARGICFVAGTLVLTEDGEVPIEEILVGDLVYSEDPLTGEEGYKQVTTVYVSETTSLVHVTVSGEEITATPAHPFWVETKGWVEAGSLAEGDALRLEEDGEFAQVERVEYESLTEPILVYNLEVADWHTYYVSSSSVLVHNACWKQWKTIVEDSSVVKALKPLSEAQKRIYEEILEKLAKGDHSGLNVHWRSDKHCWSADFKGFGGRRGNARIFFTEKEGVLNIIEIDLAHM
jgi:hypothetical protein